jgi:hypothetical protein
MPTSLKRHFVSNQLHSARGPSQNEFLKFSSRQQGNLRRPHGHNVQLDQPEVLIDAVDHIEAPVAH